jgi:uncharacterized protein
MRITEIDFNGARPIDGYGPGFFRIAGIKHDGGLALLPSGPMPWGGFDDTTVFVAAAETLDVVLVGTGADIAAMPVAFRDALVEAGIGVEFMSTPSACRTYNVLLSEGRRIGAALMAL